MLDLPAEIMALEKQKQYLEQIKHIVSLQGSQVKIVGANGEDIEITESVNNLLRKLIYAIASGAAISVIPQHQELTTQQAADFLNVSRPYLIKLLEQGEIPFIKVGTHRRIRFEELVSYKEKRDAERSKLLQELVEISEEADLYEDD
ncbi:MAG: helix-turn-helix domain-containing protein [Cyanobacteria bacterium P01_C01_bin.38]